MIRHIPNIVTLKPIGGLITNNPLMSSQESADRIQKIEAEKQQNLTSCEINLLNKITNLSKFYGT